MQLTKKVTVTIENNELVWLLIDALYPKAQTAEGKECVLFLALSSLVGRSDVDAVKVANRKADAQTLPHIKVAEFRIWLPKILAETFAEFLNQEAA